MFLELSQSDESYFCGVCLQDIFPFAQLKDDKLAKEFSKQASAKSVSLFNKILAEYNKTCSVCSKTIHLTKSSIPCGQCKHLIHKRCSEVPNWNIANIDSLLTSVVADNMTKTKHAPNRELVGQGIGNTIGAIFAIYLNLAFQKSISYTIEF